MKKDFDSIQGKNEEKKEIKMQRIKQTKPPTPQNLDDSKRKFSMSNIAQKMT